MTIRTYRSIITLNVNGLNATTKRHRLAEWIKNKTHIYALYKRPTSGLGTHTDWKWRDGKRYSMQMVIRRKMKDSLVAHWLTICHQCRGHVFEPWSVKIPHAKDYWAHVPQLLSLHSRACKPQLLSLRATTTEAHAPRACAMQQEKPQQWEARALKQRVAPLPTTRESSHAAIKTQCSHK